MKMWSLLQITPRTAVWKKLLLLAGSPSTDEDYDSIKSFASKLNLAPSKFLLCVDLQIINCALGLMPHYSRHPCPYCLWIKGRWDPCSEVRTFQRIINFNRQWRDAGGPPANLPLQERVFANLPTRRKCHRQHPTWWTTYLDRHSQQDVHGTRECISWCS